MADSCVYQCQKLCFLHRQLTFLAFSRLTEVRLHDALLIPTRHTRAIDAEELKADQQLPFQEIISYRFKYHPHDSRAKERNTKHQLSPCSCLSRLFALPTFFIGDRPAYVLSGSARERCNVYSVEIFCQFTAP